MEFEGLHPQKKTVLLISSAYQGITSKIRMAGWQYKEKHLNSAPSNWQTICDLFSQFNIVAVILRIDDSTYTHFDDEAYSGVAEELLRRISSVKHLIFAFDFDSIDDTDVPDVVYDDAFPPTPVTREGVADLFKSHNLSLVLYRRTAEMTITAIDFLADLESGLFLRVYVPHAQLWSAESSRFIGLLRNYLSIIGGPTFSLRETSTVTGRYFEFCSQNGMTADGFNAAVKEFEQFVATCARDTVAAEKMLLMQGVDRATIAEVVNRYAIEAKRLLLDLRQERERRMMAIGHRMEAELAELPSVSIDLDTAREISRAVLPSTDSALRSMLFYSGGIPFAEADLSGNLPLADRVRSIVRSELAGEATLSEDEKKLLEVIRAHGSETEIPKLISAVQQLRDSELPRSVRLTALQTLKGFAPFLGHKAADIAGGIVQTLLEAWMGIGGPPPPE